ncbi:integrase [Aquabacterium sp.]|uniref:tyrosine-type recombinase/integrase n=1 Tax=Aquabacterium sp. TaxID=1872578 RepID=UPI0025B98948|nr:integrase [Aquabacterium sp.]
MASPNLKTVEGRKKLPPKREPYSHKIRVGCYITFRKTSDEGQGSWGARFQFDGTTRLVKTSFGSLDGTPGARRYDVALEAAEAWFKQVRTNDGPVIAKTVKMVCEQYVQHLRLKRGNGPADETHARFQRRVYGHPLANVYMAKLTRRAIETWRHSLANTAVMITPYTNKENTRPRAPSSLNRDMATLRAALNFAKINGDIDTDAAWLGALQNAPNASKSRGLYLDPAQRNKLIEHADEEIQPFLTALCLLPLRPGAVAHLTVANFDPALSLLTIGKDKAGQGRRIMLPKSTAQFLATNCSDSEPSAPIFKRANGKAWRNDSWKVPIKAAFIAAGLPKEGVAYTLRHSVISDLCRRLDLATVAHVSGTSIEMIQKHYSHLQQDRAQEALAMLTLPGQAPADNGEALTREQTKDPKRENGESSQRPHAIECT